jgi:hypothetical protein
MNALSPVGLGVTWRIPSANQLMVLEILGACYWKPNRLHAPSASRLRGLTAGQCNGHTLPQGEGERTDLWIPIAREGVKGVPTTPPASRRSESRWRVMRGGQKGVSIEKPSRPLPAKRARSTSVRWEPTSPARSATSTVSSLQASIRAGTTTPVRTTGAQGQWRPTSHCPTSAAPQRAASSAHRRGTSTSTRVCYRALPRARPGSPGRTVKDRQRSRRRRREAAVFPFFRSVVASRSPRRPGGGGGFAGADLIADRMRAVDGAHALDQNRRGCISSWRASGGLEDRRVLLRDVFV